MANIRWIEKRGLQVLVKSGIYKVPTKLEGTLADSMIRESFCLLAYGFIISCFACTTTHEINATVAVPRRLDS